MNKGLSRNLHILYIVQYFNSPDEPGGSRAYQFAQSWAQKGHRVTVLTGNLNHKTMAQCNLSGVDLDGVTVIRVPTYNKIRKSFRKRMLNFLSFAVLAFVRGWKVPEYDLIYASSTPLTTGLPGYLLSILRRRPFYFEVRDLWPESAVVAGVLSSNMVIKVAEFFERRFYKRASKVVALTDGIRRGVIHKGKDPRDVMLVSNGVDDWMVNLEKRTPADFPFARDRHFVCTYIGAHGKWNRLETILECASHLKGSNVRFLLVGDGDEKDQLRQRARQLELDNVHFHDPVPKLRICDYLGQSDVALICTWDHPFQQMVLANKVFDYMAAGCPVVAAARGEMVDLIRNAACGWWVQPERPAEMAALIRAISVNSADEIREKGCNGRAFVLQHYLRRTLAATLERSFMETCDGWATRSWRLAQ